MTMTRIPAEPIIKMTKKALALATTTLLLAHGTLGFAPLPTAARFNAKANAAGSSRGTTMMFSSTLPPKETNGAQADLEQSKETAVASLQRLLSRQQSEIEETKRLLELYKYNSAENMHHDADRKGKHPLHHGEPSELLNVASSVFSGFDYGFQSRSEGPTSDNLKGGNPAAFVGYGPPSNILVLGSQQFMRNLRAMVDEYEDEEDVDLTPKQTGLRNKLEELTLNSTAIWERETKDGPLEAPWIIKIPYLSLCYMLDTVFEDKYVPSRFFLLETVARMPYFAYIAMLHFYESLGFWRRSADMKRIHFAEEMNEFHHLMIMESLGGDQPYWVRFMAQHSAIAYYVGLCLLWAVSPSLSYKFSELLETHAVNTYSQFLDENEEILKDLPPSLAAVNYYALGASDPYYAEFQTTAISQNKEIRRPGLDMESLYDVFSAIRDDEGDHVSTMEACLDPTVAKLSPSLERKALTAIATAVAIGMFLNTGGDTSMGTDLVDGIDVAADETVASGIVDAVVAGVGGIVSMMGQDGEEGLFEEGALLSAKNMVGEVLQLISRIR